VNKLYDAKAGKGEHHLDWNSSTNAGNDLPTGIYMLQFYTTIGNPVSIKIVKR
jgi:flagellar hook assembly protein FlgD